MSIETKYKNRILLANWGEGGAGSARKEVGAGEANLAALVSNNLRMSLTNGLEPGS